MAADIISRIMQPNMQQAQIVLMDDYGTEYHCYIAVSEAALAPQILADAQAGMAKRQADTEAMAQAMGLPMPAPLTLAEKQARWAEKNAPPGVSTMTVTAPAKV